MSKSLKMLLCLCVLQIFTACTGSSSDPGANQVPKQGTGDGGGGNAIDDKMLETYIIDANEIPAVQKYVLPLLKKISVNEKGQAQDWLKMKTWYRVPAKLDQISKISLGVPYSEESLQQVAFQTDSEIWIDDLIFSRMTEVEQAKLVLHEMVMMMYLTRFEKISDLCQRVQRSGGSCGQDANNSIDISEMDRVYSPEEKRSLNANDYNIIRNATAWLFANAENVTKESYETFRIQSGLADPRFDSSSNPVEKSKEITVQDLALAIKSAKLTKELPRECFAVTLNRKFKCETTIELIDTQYTSKGKAKYADGREEERTFTQPAKALRLQIKDLETNTVLETALAYIFSDKVHLSFGNGSYSFTTLTRILDTAGSATEGEISHMISLSFSADLATVIAVHSIPLVKVGERQVPDAERAKYTDNKDSKCIETILQRPRAEENLESSIVVTRNERIQKFAMLLDKIRMNGNVSCRP